MSELDLVNHPPHYGSHPSGVEVIRYSRLLPFGPGNAVKYVMRRDLKGTPITDLDKAEWYLKDSLSFGITYDITPQMGEIVRDVTDVEENFMVIQFLHAMYLPHSVERNWLDKVVGVKPDLDLALELVQALREEYTP